MKIPFFTQGRQNVALLGNDSSVPLSVLVHQVSRSIYLTRSHLEICERLAGKKFSNPDLNKLYVNLVFQKSEKARQLSALAALIKADKVNVLKVTSDFITPDFRDVLGSGIDIEFSRNKNCNLLSKTICITYIIKILLNMFYRLFRNKNLLSSDIVVKAFNRKSEQILGNYFSKAVVLLYPIYPVHFIGDMKFYLHCFLNYDRVSFFGLPYRFSDAIRIIVNCRALDEPLAQIEYAVQLRHANEIIGLDPRLFLTSDQEFGPGSFVLHRYLSSKHCDTICRSHGAWVDCPIIFYDEYHLFCSGQLEFFSLRNQDVQFILESPHESHGKLELQISEVPSKFSPVVIFVHQGFGRSNLSWNGNFDYEANFEKKAISSAARICQRLGIEFRVKPHPSVGVRKVKKDFRIDTISSMAELNGEHPIFLNIDSSAFFDFRRLGPTVFVGDEFLNCSYFLIPGNIVKWIELDHLEKGIQTLLRPEEWYNAYRLQNIV